MTAPASPIFHPSSPPSPRHIFVYGTLVPGRTPPHITPITSLMKPLGAATVRGRVYCLGPYPAMILADNTDGGELGWTDVHGMLMELPLEHEEAYGTVMGALDGWEDYDADNHESADNMYLRLIVNAVKLEDGSEVRTFVYHYNFPIDQTAVWVPTGKWEPKQPCVYEVECDSEACKAASAYFNHE